MKSQFELIYNELKDTIYGYLYYMSHNEDTAEDLSQEVFLKVYLNLHKFKGESSYKTWCLAIARNTFITYARKKQPILIEDDSIDQSLSFESNQPEELILQKEKGVMIRSVLNQLCEDDRTILLLRDYQQLSYKEISKIMDLSEVVIKGRIFRVRKKFQYMYEKQFRSGGDIDVM